MMHAAPIQPRAVAQMGVRREPGTEKPMRTAPSGIHHASKLVLLLLSQLREASVVGLLIAKLRTTRWTARLAGTLGLDRWTRHRAVTTEHAAIAGLRFQLCTAAGAFIKELTSISRHDLRFRNAAVRTGDDRLTNHRINSWVRTGNRPWWSPTSIGSRWLWHCHR
jgi:hypothetical protein